MSKKEFYLEIDEESEEPSFFENKKKNSSSSFSLSSKNFKRIKYTLLIILALLAYLLYDRILFLFFSFLAQNPTLFEMYLFLQNEIANTTIKGLFFVSILGSIFFLSLPIELLFLYMLEETNYTIFTIILLMTLGNLVGFTFNYLFGLVLGRRVLKLLFRKSYDKKEDFVQRYGGTLLFLGALLPSPIELFTVFYGAFRYPFARYFYLCMSARFLKFMALFALYLLFWDQILDLYEFVLNYVLFLKDISLS
jgi:membrane protein YqaA with SNARE-associated domain